MKHQFFGLTLALVGAAVLSSCDKTEDIISGFDKVSYQSYLRNESGQDVTVIFRPNGIGAIEQYSRFVPKDSTVEIPDTELWGLQQRVWESDTVKFLFADGTCVLHYYLTENYPSDKHIFVPEDNNIFFIGLDIPDEKVSWIRTRIRPNKYRYDYVINFVQKR